MPRRLIVAGLMAVAMSVTLAVEPSTAPAAPAKSPGIGASAPIKRIADDQLSAESRTPPPPICARQGGGAILGIMRLAGIATNRQIRLAVFQPKGSIATTVVGVGDEIAGRKVIAITARDVVISGPGGERHIQPTADPFLISARGVAQGAGGCRRAAP
jgi:hypothetical protein